MIPYKSNKLLLLCLLVNIALLTACSKKYLKGTIYMGQGGGFAASWKEFQLNHDGKLFLRSSLQEEPQFVRTLDSSDTRKIFRRYYKLKLDKNDLDAPGNMYYYVGHRIGKFRNKKVVFGHPDAPISKEIQKYFDNFINLAQDSTQIQKTN